MAISATTTWEVQGSGDNTNGGGYDSTLGGTDYTYGGTQAVTSYTDLVIDATTATKISSAAHPFNSTHAGNVINITGGTGFTVGRYLILSVASGVATCDSAVGTLGSTGGAGKLGGALADPGYAAGFAVAGNDLYVKYWPTLYPVTSATANVAGGVVSLPTGTTGDATQMIGYQTTRGDNGTKPMLQASGISTFTLATINNQCRLVNIELDANNLTNGKGIAGSQFGEAFLCRVRNCAGTAINSVVARFCEATGNTGTVFTAAQTYYCVAHDNAGNAAAFSIGAGSISVGCIASNNIGGANAHGFSMTSNGGVCVNCTAYGNAGDGFRTVGGASLSGFCCNCASANNTGYGFNSTIQTNMFWLIACATYSNTAGAMNNFNLNVAPQILANALFVNPASNNFAPNSTVGGGAALRGAAYPPPSGAYAYPGLATANYADIGAAQHQDAGGSSGGPGRTAIYRGQNLPVW